MSDRRLQTLSRKALFHRGQSLAEFALLLPIFMLLTGGIIQYGTVMATQHTLIQIGRDVGRWAATQASDPCESLANDRQPAVRAHEIALESRLMGYGGEWNDPANFTSYGVGDIPEADPSGPGVEVAWEVASGACPPVDSASAAFVTIRLAHGAPVLLPGLAYLPVLGNDGVLLVHTTTKFRMEPQALPAASGP